MVGLGERCLRVGPFGSLIANQVRLCHGQVVLVCFRGGVGEVVVKRDDILVAVGATKVAVFLVSCARSRCASEKIPLLPGFLNLDWFGAIAVPCRRWTVPVPPPPIGWWGEWCPVQPPWHGLDAILDDSN